MAGADLNRDVDYAWLRTDVVRRQAKLRPSALAVCELATGRRVTYGQLERQVARCEAVLRGLVAAGDSSMAAVIEVSAR